MNTEYTFQWKERIYVNKKENMGEFATNLCACIRYIYMYM